MDDHELSITVLESLTEELRDQECAVLVTNVIPPLSRDFIECYFENEKRSGGGTTEQVFDSQQPPGFVITFDSPQGNQIIPFLCGQAVLLCIVTLVSCGFYRATLC